MKLDVTFSSVVNVRAYDDNDDDVPEQNKPKEKILLKPKQNEERYYVISGECKYQE